MYPIKKRFFLSIICSSFIFLIPKVSLAENRQIQTAEYTEEPLNIADADRLIIGTVTIAREPSKEIFIIVPGSGNLDQNGNDGFFIKASLYRLLAQGLANKGVTTVRYQKSRPLSSKSKRLDFDRLVRDALSVVDVSKKRLQAECVWLIGHSEGGLVSILASKGADDICGVILIASPGRKLSEIIRTKLLSYPNMSEYWKESVDIITKLENGDTIYYDKISPVLKIVFNQKNDALFRQEFNIDPAKEISSCNKPFLILHGKMDIQVKFSDSEILKNSCPNSKLVIFSNLNHWFQPTSETDTVKQFIKNNNNYALIPSYVFDEIIQFIKKHD